MRRSVLALLVAVPAAVAVACTDPIAPGSGAARIELAVSGADRHTGPFTVAIDGGSPVTLEASGAIVTDLASGHHSVLLSGLAPNCAAVGTGSKGFSVNPPDTTIVSLPVGCTAVTGVIELRAMTTGPDADLDGYGVSLDGGPVQTITSYGLLRFTDLSGGPHTLNFSGVAANCTPAGPNPLEVTVPVGGTVKGIVQASLAVTCVASTGAFHITTSTSGPDRDQSYQVTWDGGVTRTIIANGNLVVAHLLAGAYDVRLADIAPNCAVNGANPVAATVAIGDTTDIDFQVTCLANPILRVSVTATGSDIPSGFSAYVDDIDAYYGTYVQVPANGTGQIVVAVGTHVVTLPYAPSNCTVTSEPSVSVTVAAGTTTDVAFTVACVSKPILRVTVATSGPNAPATYLVGVDAGYWYQYNQEATVPSNGSTSIAVLAGVHSVTLDLVPLNCVVTSPNNVTIDVPFGTTTDLSFAVTCQ